MSETLQFYDEPTYDDAHRQVISVAMKAFYKKGVKSVTMDEIAHELTMSKRTLYQLFVDKEALLLACIL
ncbi:transcriptional regulator, TetR family [gut metagenome]|uniref:Transcriptional regulator, TetR family n=1 Tax=gut metagenome TaxID=749906 RepID=J9F5X4_9ZZZZ